MFKIQNGIAPKYLCDSLPEPHETGYDLRNNDSIPTFGTRTNILHNSFFPNTIKDWNNLPASTKNAPSLDSFKQKLKDTKHKPPDWYYSGKKKMVSHPFSSQNAM